MLNRFIFYLLAFASIIANSQTRDSIRINIPVQFKDSALTSPNDSLLISFNENMNDTLLIAEHEKSKIINYQPYSNQSYFIGKTDILRNDYRYTGDFFKVFPLSFERSYGFVGQPNDIYLYAEGSASTNYFIDGVPVLRDPYGSLDFNHIQSEDIDSIEIVPLPRGFLYGFSTNPVSVNFISKDIIPAKPYSRIKYYEGPFGEAFIDGIFSIYLFKDLYATVDITNRKVDSNYTNSNFSAWQVSTKLRYNLSRDINLIGSYYFSKSETGINGGVNVDTILETTSNINSILFNGTLAPVYFGNNSLNSKQHNFGLKLLAKPLESAYTNLNFYYKFYQDEYFENGSVVSSKSTLKDRVLGILLDQRISFGFTNIYLQSGYQSLKHNPTFISSDSTAVRLFPDNSPLDYSSFFVSPILSFDLLDSMFTPSIYFKYADILQKTSFYGTESHEKFSGVGIDLSIFFNENYNFYFGYSQFDNAYLAGEKINTLEFKLSYKDAKDKVSIGLFNKKSSANNLWGADLNASYKVWKILLEGRLSQYFIEKSSTGEFINIPETKFTTGIYFKDSLFNSNLDLKTGFVAYYIGKQNIRYLPVPHRGILYDDVNASLTIDFTVSAEIQKLAIVYFTWENLFDKQYYTTPYYPMLGRNIRFGIAWEIFN